MQRSHLLCTPRHPCSFELQIQGATIHRLQLLRTDSYILARFQNIFSLFFLSKSYIAILDSYKFISYRKLISTYTELSRHASNNYPTARITRCEPAGAGWGERQKDRGSGGDVSADRNFNMNSQQSPKKLIIFKILRYRFFC